MSRPTPHFTDVPLSGLNTRDAAWLARDQNRFLAVAMRKLDDLKNRFEGDPFTLDRLLDLERVLEGMERVNRATLNAFQAPHVGRVSGPGPS